MTPWFAAKLQFTVDEAVITAMRDMVDDLDRITAERIRDEFTKLLCGADPITGLRLLVDTGLADRFLPEISGLKLEIDEHAQHKDVYEHTLIVVQNAMRLEGDGGPDFTLRMAALMHDVGKPATRRFEPNGAVTFRHHDVVGAKLVDWEGWRFEVVDLDGKRVDKVLVSRIDRDPEDTATGTLPGLEP